jgi:hypothetical protein
MTHLKTIEIVICQVVSFQITVLILLATLD